MSDATHTDLRAFSIRSGATAREALRTIRHNGLGIVVVVDDDYVKGTVTDGNIRRATLNGTSLDVAVEEVMSPRPLTLPVDAPADATSRLLNAYRLRAAPVVDQGRLVGIRAQKAHGDSPIAVVMAGGRGQRLRPFTDKVPKPLLRVGSTPIVERIISSLAAAGVDEVLLAVNYKAELLEGRLGTGERLGVRLRYLREEQPMGTAGSLSVLSERESGPVLVTNGDIVTTVDFTALLDFHWHQGAAVTVAAVPYVSHIPYGVLHTVEHHLVSMEEKPERRDLCSAGIYVLSPDVLRLVPRGVPWDMPDLIIDALREGLSVQVFPILEKWVDIGGTDEFERVLVEFALGDDGYDDMSGRSSG
ncbi:MAG: nucleotidyltransferase family protein [Actinomycetota bacterium]|nr:nucleotidyltransferase family protein [Actinomycetota bacterium]